MTNQENYLRDDHESLIVQSTDLDKNDRLDTHPIFRDNPFRSAFLHHFSDNKGTKMNFITKRADDLFDGNGEQVSDNGQSLIVGNRNTVDSATFTKVYHDALKLFGISNSASKLLIYIISTLKQNSLYIELDTDKICQEMDVSLPTYYRAVKDLLLHQVIARTPKSYIYFINPVFIFNGDRIRVVNEYIKEGSVSADILSQNANIRQISKASYSKPPSATGQINTNTSENQPDNSKAETEDEFGV